MIEMNPPKVTLLSETGLGISEIAARTCYDSFEKSEHEFIKKFPEGIWNPEEGRSIEDSELLHNLAWVYHHHSIIEHTVLSFYIEGMSRGVLQEFARHRIASYSVRSTRYTMGPILNAFLAGDNSEWTFNKLKELDFLVIANAQMRDLEIAQLIQKLTLHMEMIGIEKFVELTTSKDMRQYLEIEDVDLKYEALQKAKQKRNGGDQFKYLVTDNWKTDMVVTMNLRSLKNFFDLRDSGAAYFLMRETAKAMKEATPGKYLKLIHKEYKK